MTQMNNLDCHITSNSVIRTCHQRLQYISELHEFEMLESMDTRISNYDYIIYLNISGILSLVLT
jgi:hypothetical protein